MVASKYLCDALAEYIGLLKLEDSAAGIRYLNTKSGGEIVFKDWEKAQNILLHLALCHEVLEKEDIDKEEIIHLADKMLTYIFTLKISKTPPQDIIERIEDVLYGLRINWEYNFGDDASC